MNHVLVRTITFNNIGSLVLGSTCTCESGIFISIFSFHLAQENIHEVSWIIFFQHQFMFMNRLLLE